MTWTLAHTTTWVGPLAAPGSRLPLQDGWFGQETSWDDFSIDAANTLVCQPSNQYDPLLRPSSEIYADVLVDTTVVALPDYATPTIVLRREWTSDFYSWASRYYFFGIYTDAVQWSQNNYVAIHDFPYASARVDTHDFRIVCYVKGHQVVEGGLFIRDLTASVDLVGTNGADVNSIVYERWVDTPDVKLQVGGGVGLVTTSMGSRFGPISIYTDLADTPEFPAARGRG